MFLDRGDATLFVTDHGPGPRTLIAHGGFVGSGELWTEPFGLLSRSWRTITYDHRGTGVSRHHGRITLSQLVDDLFAVMDACEVEHPVLAGESMGAKVAMMAVLREPSRFGGLVIVDGSWRHHPPGGPVDALIAGCRADYRKTIGAFVDTCVVEPDGDDARHWGRQIVYRSDGESAAQLLEAAQALDISADVGSIQLPTLIIHGSEDRIVPVAAAEELARELPHSKLVVIEGAGDVPTITRPRQVTDAISEFFEGH